MKGPSLGGDVCVGMMGVCRCLTHSCGGWWLGGVVFGRGVIGATSEDWKPEGELLEKYVPRGGVDDGHLWLPGLEGRAFGGLGEARVAA